MRDRGNVDVGQVESQISQVKRIHVAASHLRGTTIEKAIAISPADESEGRMWAS